MKLNRLTGWLTAAAGFLFLSAAPGLTCAQDSRLAVAQPPRMVAPAARPTRDPRSADEFAGLKFTAEQKEKIDEIGSGGLVVGADGKSQRVGAGDHNSAANAQQEHEHRNATEPA